MTFELIVFDWDGTLMDSEARIVNCLQAAFTDLGMPVPRHEAARDVIGLGLSEAIARLMPGVEQTTVEALGLAYRRHFLDLDPTPSTLFPGVREFLSALLEENYRLAIATGKGRVGLERALAETGLAGCFHATRCADETFSKPHPQMLLELMDELGASASATLMVGDTEYDMLMARNARTKALAVCYGVHPVARLMTHQPLDCLSDLRRLPTWLRRLAAGEASVSTRGMDAR